MVKDMIARVKNFAMLSILLPFVCGCNGGGGGSASLGSLLGGDGAPAAVTPPPGGEVVVASLHSPEPATLLLLGSGIAAIGYMSRKKNQKR